MSAGQDHLPPPGSAFALSRRGYDPVQVDDYLRHIDAQLRMLAADRDAAVEQNAQLTRQVNVAWAETDRLKAQLRRLSAPPESVEGLSERLQCMLRLAQEEVAERRKRAEAEAAEIIARAEAKAGDLPRQNEAMRRQLEHDRQRLHAERDKILAEAREEADRAVSEATVTVERMRAEVTAETTTLREQAEEERRTLDAESAAKRRQVEEDFEIAMSARRADAMAEIHRAQNASRDEANSLLAGARAQAAATIGQAEDSAQTMVRAAQRRVAELDALRTRVASQLTQLRAVLDAQLPQLLSADGSSSSAHPDTQLAQALSADGSSSVRADTQLPAPPAPTPPARAMSQKVAEPHQLSGNGSSGHQAEPRTSASSGQDDAPPSAAELTATGPGATTPAVEAPADPQDDGSRSPEDAERDQADFAALAEPTPAPRKSPETRPSPRRRRPVSAGRRR